MKKRLPDNKEPKKEGRVRVPFKRLAHQELFAHRNGRIGIKTNPSEYVPARILKGVAEHKGNYKNIDPNKWISIWR